MKIYTMVLFNDKSQFRDFFQTNNPGLMVTKLFCLGLIDDSSVELHNGVTRLMEHCYLLVSDV